MPHVCQSLPSWQCHAALVWCLGQTRVTDLLCCSPPLSLFPPFVGTSPSESDDLGTHLPAYHQHRSPSMPDTFSCGLTPPTSACSSAPSRLGSGVWGSWNSLLPAQSHVERGSLYMGTGSSGVHCTDRVRLDSLEAGEARKAAWGEGGWEGGPSGMGPARLNLTL